MGNEQKTAAAREMIELISAYLQQGAKHSAEAEDPLSLLLYIAPEAAQWLLDVWKFLTCEGESALPAWYQKFLDYNFTEFTE